MAGNFECGNEYLVREMGEFFDWLRKCQLLIRTVLHGSMSHDLGLHWSTGRRHPTLFSLRCFLHVKSIVQVATKKPLSLTVSFAQPQ